MKKIFVLCLILALSTVFNVSLNAEGVQKSTTQYSPITELEGDGFAGLAQVHRDHKGVDFHLHSIGVESGHAYTAWTNIDDDGDGISEILFRVGGGIVGDSREIEFKGRVIRGKVPAVDGESVLTNEGDGKFNKPLEATIVFFIRDHGMIIEDQLIDQVTRINGGCEDNTCMTIQSTTFEPPVN